MTTLGISFGRFSRHATCCTIQWPGGLGLPETPKLGVPDEALVPRMEAADWTAVTGAPFGFPDAMLDAIVSYAEDGRWERPADPELLHHRLTDRFVMELLAERGTELYLPPATDPDSLRDAGRIAHILTEHASRADQPLDRIGVPGSTGMDGPPDLPRGLVQFPTGGVIETSAAAALAAWGLPFDGYSPADAYDSTGTRAVRERVLHGLEHETGVSMIVCGDVRAAAAVSYDALEALIAAIVAFAAATDETIKPTLTQRGAARREGWIHLPS
ncbi:hypothetical protein Q5424_05010 [Conexibacter sp. JD483]|uniref:hypothetical protein n=1 Tax=unclassified Conexibacter TaxID=2627773 RepID=UPI00271F5274|nr:MULTISPECIES: hypothetical protein [unclassified Conexibacter]MDO8184693.1 hypothetical protein [Conexibacter sp. CPCC 205706]MDO8197999.1 hypothetical protein [Conexibacter sp. CPCC 205762]MDR9368429.1 hypothetical protein [Conexibacter sp. JD483]